MEIVNTNRISAGKWLYQLIMSGGINNFLRGYQVACFLLTRTVETPNLYDQLIEQVTTIDSTTRDNIAFIVFQQNTTIYTRAQPRGMTEVQIEGMKVVGSLNAYFDDTLASLIRVDPQKFNRNTFAAEMTRASDALMDIYGLSESVVPCLLFMDIKNPEDIFIRSLYPNNTFIEIYSNILKPLSEVFRLYKKLINVMDEKDSIERQLKELKVTQETIQSMKNSLVDYHQIHNELQHKLADVNGLLNDSNYTKKQKKQIELYLPKPLEKNQKEFQDMLIFEDTLGDTRLSERLRDFNPIYKKYKGVANNIKQLEIEISKYQKQLELKYQLTNSSIDMYEIQYSQIKQICDLHNWSWLYNNFTMLRDGNSTFNLLKLAIPSISSISESSSEEYQQENDAKLKELLREEEFLMKKRREDNRILILFLAANPLDTIPLRLDKEIREIDIALRKTEFRDNFDIKQHWAVRVVDLHEYLLRHKPNIVHFSGHGSKSNEIILENQDGTSHPASVRALGKLFSILKDNIQCVVLNACYSEHQAQAIAEHVNCVIGMSQAIGDQSAINFATAFYRALGYGKDVKTAFDLGCNQIDFTTLDDEDIPKLVALKIKPEDIVFFHK